MFPPGCFGTNFVTSYTRSCTMTQQSVERLCFATSPAVKTFFSSSKFDVDFFFSFEDRRRRTDEEVEEEGAIVVVASGLHIPKKREEEENVQRRERERERNERFLFSLFFFVVSCGPQNTFEKMKTAKKIERDRYRSVEHTRKKRTKKAQKSTRESVRALFVCSSSSLRGEHKTSHLHKIREEKTKKKRASI